jgi:hypothetical protein
MKLETKKEILRAVSDYLDKEGFDHIRAQLDNMEKPKNIAGNISGNIFRPDMVACHRDASYVFEIETGEGIEKEYDRFINKCRLFQEYASSKKGKLYLIVPIQQFDKVLAVLNRNEFDRTGIIQINTS